MGEELELRCMVVDDEPPARQALCMMLSHLPEVGQVVGSGSVEEAAALLEHQQMDVLFLDIQLRRRTGFELLETLGARRPPALVFVTAFDRHAVHAFEVEACDYLLKPIDDARLSVAIERAARCVRQDRVRQLTADLAAALGPSQRRADDHAEVLTLREGAKTTLLPWRDIDWIEAQDYYSEIHAGGATHLLREPLRTLESKLDTRRFVRIHRSTVVQLDRVREVRTLPSGDGIASLRDGTELRVSRTRCANHARRVRQQVVFLARPFTAFKNVRERPASVCGACLPGASGTGEKRDRGITIRGLPGCSTLARAMYRFRKTVHQREGICTPRRVVNVSKTDAPEKKKRRTLFRIRRLTFCSTLAQNFWSMRP
jgi:two-component system, LytTR family, response regulator